MGTDLETTTQIVKALEEQIEYLKECRPDYDVTGMLACIAGLKEEIEKIKR